MVHNSLLVGRRKWNHTPLFWPHLLYYYYTPSCIKLSSSPGKVADQRRTDDKKSDKTIFLPLLAFFWSYFTHSIQFGLRRQRESKIGVSLQSQCLF